MKTEPKNMGHTNQTKVSISVFGLVSLQAVFLLLYTRAQRAVEALPSSLGRSALDQRNKKRKPPGWVCLPVIWKPQPWALPCWPGVSQLGLNTSGCAPSLGSNWLRGPRDENTAFSLHPSPCLWPITGSSFFGLGSWSSLAGGPLVKPKEKQKKEKKKKQDLSGHSHLSCG